MIYTLPVSFLLILNTMRYIDKKFSVVSRVMGDKPLKTFLQTVARPLLGTLAASMVQCFFLWNSGVCGRQVRCGGHGSLQ